jgi:amidase
VFGLKPSRGRVSGAPGPQSWNATSGPIARTVADAAALLDVMQGYASGDSWWLPPPARPFVGEAGAPAGRLRIAWTTEHPDPDMEVESAWRDAVTSTAELLAEQGHELVEAAPPAIDLGALALVPASSVAARPDLPPVDTLDATNRTLVAITEAASARDLADALWGIQAETRRVVAFFDDYDALLTPTLAAGPPLLGDRIMGEEDWEGMLQLLLAVTLERAEDLAGHALGVDTTEHVPMTVDVADHERDVLDVARAVHEAAKFAVNRG